VYVILCTASCTCLCSQINDDDDDDDDTVQETTLAGIVSLHVQQVNSVYQWIGCVILKMIATMDQTRLTVVRVIIDIVLLVCSWQFCFKKYHESHFHIN